MRSESRNPEPLAGRPCRHAALLHQDRFTCAHDASRRPRLLQCSAFCLLTWTAAETHRLHLAAHEPLLETVVSILGPRTSHIACACLNVGKCESGAAVSRPCRGDPRQLTLHARWSIIESAFTFAACMLTYSTYALSSSSDRPNMRRRPKRASRADPQSQLDSFSSAQSRHNLQPASQPASQPARHSSRRCVHSCKTVTIPKRAGRTISSPYPGRN